MNATRLVMVFAIGLLILTTLGCDTTRPPGAATPDPVPSRAYPQIAATEGLDDFLSYGDVIVRGQGNADQPMSVVVPVRVRADRDIHVLYRFEFFDAGNRPIQPLMEWRYLQMQARVMHFMEGSSLDPAAQSWRLIIRPAR